MNYQQALNEHIQEHIRESVSQFFDSTTIEDVLIVTLTIGKGVWSVQSPPDMEAAKDHLAREALKELQRLGTETAIRQKLGLTLVRRNRDINLIRDALRRIKQQLKQDGKLFVLPILARIYPHVDWIEYQLTHETLHRTVPPEVPDVTPEALEFTNEEVNLTFS